MRLVSKSFVTGLNIKLEKVSSLIEGQKSTDEEEPQKRQRQRQQESEQKDVSDDERVEENEEVHEEL